MERLKKTKQQCAANRSKKCDRTEDKCEVSLLTVAEMKAISMHRLIGLLKTSYGWDADGLACWRVNRNLARAHSEDKCVWQ